MVQVTANVLCVFSQVVLIRSMSFSLFTMFSMNICWWEWCGSGGRALFVSGRTGLCQFKVIGKLRSELCCQDMVPAGIDFIVSLLWVDFSVAY